MAMEDASTCRVSADVLERLRLFVVTRWGDRATMSITTRKRKRIYALGGEGFISVIQQSDPDHYTLSANIPYGHVGKRNMLYTRVPGRSNKGAEL